MNLILITTTFPYGTKESFLESELWYASTYFDKIDIFAIFPENNIIRQYKAPPNIHYHQVQLSKSLKFNALCAVPFKFFFWKEMEDTQQRKLLNIRSLRHLIYTTMMSLAISKNIFHQLRQKTSKTEKTVIYSYWLSIHAVVACLLKRNLPHAKTVSRAHGYDLYEYRNDINYISYRKFLLKQETAVFPISANGKKYLAQYSASCKTEVRRLGTIDYGVTYSYKRDLKTFRIVSCSWCVPVKRIHLIIEALSKIRDFRIEWKHFGDGTLLNSLKEKARKELPDNICWSFVGSVNNSYIYNYYKFNSIDAFINVSTSEGIPVSIMEAMSYGIPAIATDVGATAELVNTNNGILLNANFKTMELANALRKLQKMSNEDYLQLRINARVFWKDYYNAEVNYKDFYKALSQL